MRHTESGQAAVPETQLQKLSLLLSSSEISGSYPLCLCHSSSWVTWLQM